MLILGKAGYRNLNMVSEQKLILPDKEVLVVGVNHGLEGAPFPSRINAEQQITTQFPNGVSAWILDSMPPIETDPRFFRSDIRNSLRREDRTLNFFDWGMMSAAEGSAQMIAADPVNLVPGFIDILLQEFRRVYSVDEEHLFGEFMLPMDRRVFLKVFAAVALGSLVPDSASSNELKSNATCELSDADLNKTFSMLDEPREITRSDFQDPSVRCLAENGESLKIILGLRNALIAEIIDQPTSELLGNTIRLPASLAVILGLRHLLLPEELRTTWLITHPNERRNTISLTLRGLVDNIRRKIYPDVDYTQFVNGIRSYPRRYQFQNGRFVHQRIGTPFLRSLLS